MAAGAGLGVLSSFSDISRGAIFVSESEAVDFIRRNAAEIIGRRI